MFEKLLEPGKIGKLELDNRIVMLPMATAYATAGGMVTDQQVHYYAERARGGVGLIIVEVTQVQTHIDSWVHTLMLSIDNRKNSFGFTDLTRAIHLNGSKVALQLTPGPGSWVVPRAVWTPGFQSVGPTTFAYPGSVARALATEEVEALVQVFGVAAQRARRAGFDAIEIHGHSSYMLGQFMSPYVNTRTDKFGDLWRFPVELLRCAKDMSGPDFPVIFRLSGDEFIEGGRTLDGSIELCKRLEEAGVDALDVSGGTYYTPESDCVFPYMTSPRGTFVPQAQEIKKAVRVPVIAVGRLSDPTYAESVLREGKADFIGMGRGLIADPELPKKVAAGRVEDIRPCIYCNACIGGQRAGRHRLACQVNARVGKEREYGTEPARNPKKVLVIGGGPGGMEAARVAALRGHSVTLYEREERLGGHLIEASTPEHKKDLARLIKWLSSQVKAAGTRVVTGKEVTPEMVLTQKPGAVIVAVGAEPLVPEIPGIQNPSVATAVDVLLGKVTLGNRVVVAGGGAVGCDVAAFLADSGKLVTVVEMLSGMALDMEDTVNSRGQLLAVLGKKAVTCLTDMKIEEITDDGVIASDKGGVKRAIGADNVVLALGFKPRTGLYNALKGRVPEVYAVGDCVESRRLGDAIHEGFFRAKNI
ncbi:MAG: hypothetical protein A2144_00770 [Chloroflexi bacterium RBG_16_50_9]|nr:MAG: hypothetical protein A2144_00770 [Chloroflexi bacterium RBG_16_50_9]